MLAAAWGSASKPGSSQQREGVELWARVGTAAGEPSRALHTVRSAQGRKECGSSNRLDAEGGAAARRSQSGSASLQGPQGPLAWGRGRGVGGEGRSRAEWVEWRGRPKEMRQPFPPADSRSSGVCGARRCRPGPRAPRQPWRVPRWDFLPRRQCQPGGVLPLGIGSGPPARAPGARTSDPGSARRRCQRRES
ncbi:protein eva-1 homolog A isoform X2 [Camelus bactrianus]|uniref:Protein eva-1 homolog A isoform X2 n=1 Tax=Camelus bactrianus TaxID=9837 RepID=A0A9W3FI56_CAMBA